MEQWQCDFTASTWKLPRRFRARSMASPYLLTKQYAKITIAAAGAGGCVITQSTITAAVESPPYCERNFLMGEPGPSGPAVFAFHCPRPPLGSFTKLMHNKKALSFQGERALVPITSEPVRRIGLGHPLGRDSWRAPEHNMHIRKDRSL